VIVGLALVTIGNFAGVTAAQLGVSSAVAEDRGMASAFYFSAYYVVGSIGGYVPGLAWEAWNWTGVSVLGLLVYAGAAGAIALTATARRGGPPRDAEAAPRRLLPVRDPGVRPVAQAQGAA